MGEENPKGGEGSRRAAHPENPGLQTIYDITDGNLTTT